jgi:hypothetical protein
MTAAALRAIVGARLRAERRSIAFGCTVAAVVGCIQPHGIGAMADPRLADVATRSVWLAGPMFLCSTIGVALAVVQGPGRHPYLDTNERSAPLFGRELARAKAIAPVVAATLATLVYWAAQFLTGFAAPPTFFILALASVIASALVALNATVRTGTARAAALLLAALTVAIAYVLSLYADPQTPHRGDAIGVASELLFCAAVGFFALREYGESLARFDPLT